MDEEPDLIERLRTAAATAPTAEIEFLLTRAADHIVWLEGMVAGYADLAGQLYPKD